ncbi:MAG: hypothetical protein IIY92_07095, partial [Lachnospiraceae bacterium]|nr:hypothetical protein [Lachnospiraceae bacterium]
MSAREVELFEQEIVATNGESFYIPEGYRYIRQITLDYPKEATLAAKAQEKPAAEVPAADQPFWYTQKFTATGVMQTGPAW